MGTIKGQGAPTRDTKGSIGDTYTDITTGRKYKCTNAYGVHGDFDYTWRLQVNDKAAPVKEEIKSIPKEEPKAEAVAEPVVEEVKEEPVKEVKQPKKSQKKVENTSTEEQAEPATKRVDYTAAYNKAK